MAATIAKAIGRGNGVEREGTRLGPESSEAQANTFKTFTTCKVNANGSGYMQLEREINGKRELVVRIKFGTENEMLGTDRVKISGYGEVTFPQGVSFTIDERPGVI